MPKRIFAFILLLALSACPAQNAAPQMAPDVTLPMVGGGKMSLSSLRGRVVYVDFWATWCGPCLAAIPELASMQARMAKEDFSVFAISTDDLPIDRLSEFAIAKGMAYPVALGSYEIMGQFGYSQGLPTGYLLDREGRIRKKYVGKIPMDMVEQEARQLLAEKAAHP